MAPNNNNKTDTTGQEDDNYEYVFGFGSIMNSSTHAPWLEKGSGGMKNAPLPGRVVRIKKEFGYQRHWNFRSTTGFTALGVCRKTVAKETSNMVLPCEGGGMIGVLFEVPSTMMPGFDRREIGYDKVQIPLKYVELCGEEEASAFELTQQSVIWIYVPQPSQCQEADESHPLLQSYVDTVMQGCIEWGGEAMAEEFVLSTGSWSPYFLNDTPSSRRPWLFRKDYDIIDAILRKHSALTRYADRRHPEEFASTFLIRRMRGTWSIPRRNRHFTGRDMELGQIHARLAAVTTQQYTASGSGGSVNFLFVQGMGGVGKSSICTEYCYRQFPSTYGLVVWLNAESAETLVADYRQLLADLAAESLDASGNNSKDNAAASSTEEVIAEVKTRLFRCQVPWLLVFDNLEDRKLLDKFVPRGAISNSKGHVLVTSRVVELESGSGPRSLVLGCLSPSESIEMLRRALGGDGYGTLGSKDEAAAKEICDRLGHLPLALGMAAAYMQRCDVSCVEYVDRYVRSEETGRSLLRHRAGRLDDYSLTVSASLSLSLKAIAKESNTASEVLSLLCWLGPDHISKALLRGLLSTKNRLDEKQLHGQSTGRGVLPLGGTMLLSLGFVAGGLILLAPANRRRAALTGLATLSLAGSVAATVLSSTRSEEQLKKQPPQRVSSGGLALDEFEQADVVWNILKSFSILTVKQGKGSMHRLLAQALRSAQTEEESCYNLTICIDSMPLIWQFHPNKPETWQDSFQSVEHVKSLVSRVADKDESICPEIARQAGILSKQAGVFAAMATNGFIEAQASLELALKLFERYQNESRAASRNLTMKAKAEALHELGRVLRYQGNFVASEDTLKAALSLRDTLSRTDSSAKSFVADTLHELGALEVKKHSLDTAQAYLTKALELRRKIETDSNEVDGNCAATLHQLAAVLVARKPPSLEQAETLLQEALKLSRQIGQRAATLKQLARVTIRQGQLDAAEEYLRRALELYIELYGERTMHINVAGVKFQQGALAFQRDQLEEAWIHFSECLRIRRHVYAYAKPHDEGGEKSDNPLHLEVSCVVHELGCVAFAQGRFAQSLAMLQSETQILEKLEVPSTQTERLRQAMLTNLTWLLKCAKEMGDEAALLKLSADRAQLKSKGKGRQNEAEDLSTASERLVKAALECRLHVRQFALSRTGGFAVGRQFVLDKLSNLAKEVARSPSGSMRDAAQEFYDKVSTCVRGNMDSVPKGTILSACDSLRDALRAHGAKVSDAVTAS